MPEDRIEEMGDDLRVSSAGLPNEIKTALADPKIRGLTAHTQTWNTKPIRPMNQKTNQSRGQASRFSIA